MELRVKRAPHIDTEITVPGDKSISHRAAIIAALSIAANGSKHYRGGPGGNPAAARSRGLVARNSLSNAGPQRPGKERNLARRSFCQRKNRNCRADADSRSH